MSELKNRTNQEMLDCMKACKEKAEKDPVIRELLSKDPAKAIKEISGKVFPVDCFNELSETDLEATVGGSFISYAQMEEMRKQALRISSRK